MGFIGPEYLYGGKQITRAGLEDHFCGKLLGYQSTSFHDALYVREVLGLRPAPEFEAWLLEQGVTDRDGRLLPRHGRVLALRDAVGALT